MAQARLVIYTSEDGRGNWSPVKPEDVPDWVKDEDTLGSMLEGQMAHNPDIPESGWYAAVKCEDGAVITLHDPILKAAPQTIVVPE